MNRQNEVGMDDIDGQSSAATHTKTMPEASRRFGRNPRGSAQKVNLAVRQSLRHLIQRYKEFRIVVACSGGADSLALGAAAIDCCYRMGITCDSVTIDHGLRCGSLSEAKGVAAWMRFLGANTARVMSVDAGNGCFGPEGNARHARYAALNLALEQDLETNVSTAAIGNACTEIPYKGGKQSPGSLIADFSRVQTQPTGLQQGEELLAKPLPGKPYPSSSQRVFIMLGHTLDDQAETVLLGLGRGSGAHSLRGMTVLPQDDDDLFVRPLLGVRRKDTEQCCKYLGLDYVEDPTNSIDGHWRKADGNPLRRTALRHRVLPALKEALGHDVAPALARTAAMLHDDDTALEHIANDLYQRNVTRANVSSSYIIDTFEVKDIPKAIRRRLIRRVLINAGCPGGALTSTHIYSVDTLIVAWRGQKPLNLPGGVRAWRRSGTNDVVIGAQVD
ncbi:MAG: tRNA lysidine(34) synthetase [Actinomycetaceae bacterium]|nr:tRNA lysidine(34) synthetase [Actinomycetaceae bacterium]